jgi:hypothetical protein
VALVRRALTLGCALFLLAGEVSAQNVTARLTGVSGDVSVRPSGGSFADASDGESLQAADDIATGPDGRATLTFSDGTTVTLEASTQCNIASLARQRGDVRVRVNLKIGQVEAKISKSETATPSFSVRTPNATASVRGTEFKQISYYPPRGTEVELITGRVQVSSSRTSVVQGPNEHSVVQQGGRLELPREYRTNETRAHVEPVGVSETERNQIATANQPLAAPVTSPETPISTVNQSSTGTNGGATLILRFQRQ